MVKTQGAQRESGGVIVLKNGAEQNVSGEKGPDFDHVCEEGKREGMTGDVWSNYSAGPLPGVVENYGSALLWRRCHNSSKWFPRPHPSVGANAHDDWPWW